jgi:hypothetical protein
MALPSRRHLTTSGRINCVINRAGHSPNLPDGAGGSKHAERDVRNGCRFPLRRDGHRGVVWPTGGDALPHLPKWHSVA